MATAYKVIAPCVLAKDKHGRTHHYYAAELGAGESVITWLSEDDAPRLIADGLVIPIEVETDAEAETTEMLERVSECLEALTSADAPADCGAPTAREILRDRGHRFGNDVIAAAVKARKATLLSGTAPT